MISIDQHATTQLPVSSYFDEALFEREKAELFAKGPCYLGHELMVPHVGDFVTLAGEDEARVLVRHANGIKVLSNICKHRQALMLGGGSFSATHLQHEPTAARGNVKHIVCPLHRWTYNLEGQLLGAPHFESTPCVHLTSTSLERWRGLLFEEKSASKIVSQLEKNATAGMFDFNQHMLGHIEVHDCPYNWKTFVEVYLDDYHVEAFHAGLGQFVSCDDLRWETEEDCSIQMVGIRKDLNRSGSPAYERWQNHIVAYAGNTLPKYGAIWLMMYPNIMLEWYPYMMVVSTLWPNGINQTRNVIEFYHPEDILLFEPALAEAGRLAYMETCLEDDEIALRMDAGRQALHKLRNDQVGPYHPSLEAGVAHFHQWYRLKMQGMGSF